MWKTRNFPYGKFIFDLQYILKHIYFLLEVLSKGPLNFVDETGIERTLHLQMNSLINVDVKAKVRE